MKGENSDVRKSVTRAVSESIYKLVNFRNNSTGKETNNVPSDDKISLRLRQCYVTLGPLLITISLGMIEGFSATLLPQLEKEGTMSIDYEMASWIASISALPTPLGCALGGWLMEVIGRKTIHMLSCIPCLIGWICIYFSTTTTPLLIGRFLTGICLGLLGPPTGVYAAETSAPEFRGFLLALISLALTLGIALSHILGSFINWRNTALVGCIFPITCLIVMIPAPESPTYLTKKLRISDAKKAFYWCRGHGDDAEVELQELIQRQGTITQMPRKSVLEYLVDLKKPEFLKPLIIMLLFFVTNQWSGSNAMTFYNVEIVKQTLGDSFNEYSAMIMMDVIRLLASVLACYLLKRMGRRPLAMLSCIGTCFSLAVICSFTFFAKLYPSIQDYSVISLIALISYMAFVSIGIIPLPWTMMGEVFPLAHRGMGTGITSLLNYALIFSVVKTTPWMFLNLGTDGTFLLFGNVCLVGTILLAIFLPETKDKPLHVIEDYFKGIVKKL